MRFSKYIMAFTLWPLLLVQKCAKDSEETNDDNAVEIRYNADENVTKVMAIEDWEQFLKQSQQDIDETDTQIGLLETKLDEADTDEKNAWQGICDSSNLSLLKLKASRAKQNKAFEDGLSTYDKTMYHQNEIFEIQFNHEMAAINKKLATLFEKMRSGYYK
ncbi:hypothetical protein [Flavobacterium sp.]|uniref:hypothetical protein n=1 Tax=Flavobacterium sp. TaxID=239 RepID=UPI00286AE817|nr:hypothetical protein [Flavobacterium sp.]